MLWSEKVKSMMAEAVAELQGKICLMQIRVSPFPEVSLVGTVLMFPVVPCGPAHKMQLFPTDSFISTLEIVPPGPAQPAGTDCFLYIVTCSISVQA